MKKKNILLLVLSVIFSLSISSVKAIEVEDGWTLLEKGTTTIEVDKLEEFEEKLAYRVNELNRQDLDRVYRYKYETNDDNTLEDYLEISNNKAFDNEEEAYEWADNNEPKNDGWSFITNIVESFSVDKVLDLIRFETKEEALNEVNNFINSVDDKSADTTITEVRDETGDIIVSVENTYKFNTFEDAYNASLELIDSNHDYKVTVNVYEGEPEYVETKTLTLDSIFDTKSDALNYITLLENNGYTVEYEIEEINELSTLNEIYETKEEAEAKLAEFLENYPETTISNIEEVRDETGDVTENVDNDYKFNSKEEANLKAEELKENEKYYQVTVTVVEEAPEYVETITEEFEATFKTETEALSFITSMEDAGYTVEYEIEEINELSTLNEIYETKEEAEAKLAEFLENYPETTISNIEELRDETGDITENVDNDYKFNSKEEANLKAEELKENEKYYQVTVTVVEEAPEYVETITEEFTATFKTETEALSFITSMEDAGYTVEYEIEEINELSTLNEIYETKEEAQARLAEFLENYPETTISNIEEVRDETGDVTINVENTYKFDTFENAYNASLELIENNHDYIVSVNVYKGEPELESTKDLTLNKVFDNREQATNYINSLEEAGYTVEAAIKEVIQISTLNETYNTYEEAEQALEEFKNTLKELSSSNITETRDTTEDTITTITGTTEYNTYEEALGVANSLNENTDKYQVVATIREGNKTVVTGPTDVESDQFDTYDEALAYIDELERAGYDVSNLEIELIPFEESIWGDDENVEVNPGEDDDTKFTYNHFDITLVTSFTKVDASGNRTTVNGSIAINKVKIANKDITMEGPSRDPNEGYYEYTSEERRRLRVTEESLVEISGTVTYIDPTTKEEKTLPFAVSGYLSEEQNACGGKGDAKGFDLEFESVTIINNKVVIDTNIINKYKVVGTITKTETIPVYYVDTTKTTYGYDYTVSAEGTKLVGYQVVGSAVKNTYKDVYLLDIKKTTKDYDYKVTADGVKFIEYLVTGTKAMDIYQNVYTLDIKKTTKDYDYKVTADGVKFIEYLVTGTKAIDIYQDVYLLDIKKTTKDYDYRVTADGVKFIGHQVNGLASKDIYQDVYLLDIKKTTLDYDYEVMGTGIKTYYDVISKYARLINVEYIIEYMELGKGGDVEVLPPQTGVTTNNSLINVVASLILGLIIVIRKFI